VIPGGDGRRPSKFGGAPLFVRLGKARFGARVVTASRREATPLPSLDAPGRQRASWPLPRNPNLSLARSTTIANTSGWAAAAQIGRQLGLEWGGDWTGFVDRPHYQWRGKLELADCRDLYPSGLQSVWDKVPV